MIFRRMLLLLLLACSDTYGSPVKSIKLTWCDSYFKLSGLRLASLAKKYPNLGSDGREKDIAFSDIRPERLTKLVEASC